MTEIYRVRVSLPARSALPRDDIDNTLFFTHADGPASLDYDNLRTDISNFFNVGHPSQILKNYLSYDRDNTTDHAKVTFYKEPALPGGTAGPTAVRSWTLAAPVAGSVSLPEQVAIGLSFHADLTGIVERAGATRPAARRRGRIFIGPLNNQAMNEGAGAIGAQDVSSSLMQLLATAAHDLLVAAQGHGWTWVVFSRVDWAAYPVVGGFVDDRFDTQRRRLQEPSGRQTWTS